MGKHKDLAVNTANYTSALREFFMNTEKWRTFDPGVPLAWQRVRFGLASKAHVPEQRGIYAFTVEALSPFLPHHGYILYMGITGNAGDANLRKRFAQYLLHLKNEDGRPKVYMMLSTWRSDLMFNFVPLPDPAVDLALIETRFLDAVVPPVNERDFSAEITAARKAAF